MNRPVPYPLPFLLFATFFLALASAQAGQAPAPSDGLPEAPGKAVLLRTCTVCHGADYIVDPPRTVAHWQETLEMMKAYGAEASDDDWKAVTNYLIAQLAQVKVNDATAEHVELIFGVDRKIAEGVIAYRDMQGGFKTIDDLKKAPELDPTKIDSLKARLVF